MNECCCKRKAIRPVPASVKKLLHLLVKGPHSLRSASLTLHRHAWVDGSRFPVLLQKPGTAHTQMHTHRLTHTQMHTHTNRNTHVTLCMKLIAFKLCQSYLAIEGNTHWVALISEEHEHFCTCFDVERRFVRGYFFSAGALFLGRAVCKL